MKKGIRYDYPKKSYAKGSWTQPYDEKLKKLYDTIKEKRDNAKLELDNADSIDYNTRNELKGTIMAYDDILSLMESMK